MLHLNHLPNAIPDEKIVHVLHRHPLTIFWLVLGYLLLLGCVPFLFWYLPFYQAELIADPVLMPLVVLGASAFFLFAWLFLFQNFMDYYLDVWIVTNKRVLAKPSGAKNARITEGRPGAETAVRRRAKGGGRSHPIRFGLQARLRPNSGRWMFLRWPI